MEAKYHGVPVIGIPIFGEQTPNMETAVHDGWAEICHMFELTEQVLTETIGKVLNNQKYAINIQIC